MKFSISCLLVLETFIFKNTFLLFGLNVHLIAVLKITSENKGSYEKKMRIIFLLSLLVIRGIGKYL